jgi:hypothetical protein
LEDIILKRIKDEKFNDPNPNSYRAQQAAAMIKGKSGKKKILIFETYFERFLFSKDPHVDNNNPNDLSQEKSKLGLGEVS